MTETGTQSRRNGLFITISNLDFEIKIAVIAVSVVLIFFQDIYLIGSEALGSDYFNYVLIIPVLMAFLIYRKRKVLAALVRVNDDRAASNVNLACGISALIISLMIYLYGTGTLFPPDYHLIALQVFLASTVLMLFNRQTLRILIFPILLISTALPSVISFGLSIWIDLSWASTYVGDLGLKVLGLNAFFLLSGNVPSISMTGSNGQPYTFVVGVASSGVYSVVGFTLFALFVAYIAGGSLIRRTALFLLGYPLLIIINIVRLIVIIGAAYLWGDVAFNVFHFSSGIILVFFVTFLLLIIGDRFFKLQFFSTPSRLLGCSYCNKSQNLGQTFCPNCGRFLQIGTGILRPRHIISIVSVGIAVLVFMSILIPAVAVASTPSNVDLNSLSKQGALSLLPQVRGWNLSYVFRDVQTQEVLDQDAALIYTYSLLNSNQSDQGVQIPTTVQISAGLHIPEASLVTHPQVFGQPGATVLQDVDVPILNNPPLTGRFFAYQLPNDNNSNVIFYWNLRAVFNLGSYSDFRNVQISLFANPQVLAADHVIKNSSDLAGVKQFLLPLAISIANFWAPQQTSSLIQTSVTRFSLPVSLVAIAPAAVIVGKTTMDDRRRRKASDTFYDQISSGAEKDLLSSITNCEAQKKLATTEEVMKMYVTITGREIQLQDALGALTYAERAGLVRQTIADYDGQPVAVWESLLSMKKMPK